MVQDKDHVAGVCALLAASLVVIVSDQKVLKNHLDCCRLRDFQEVGQQATNERHPSPLVSVDDFLLLLSLKEALDDIRLHHVNLEQLLEWPIVACFAKNW